MSARRYQVTVLGEGPVNGTWARVVLATRETVSPDDALLFLRRQARRIANGLDPGPCSGWFPPGASARIEERGPDAPTQLRLWCTDSAAQEAARSKLVAGTDFTLTAADAEGHFTLRAVPIAPYIPHRIPRLPAPERAAPALRTGLVVAATLAAYAVLGWLLAVPPPR
ncbi:hypothetical protein AB0O07_02250 [Streptomyces sp. NPDC093085]|uniref:hypothetical protein n=1 Tax=Streptomyces sp. NPDC093085 TaxID=3155068 RepID=UPI003432B2B4